MKINGFADDHSIRNKFKGCNCHEEWNAVLEHESSVKSIKLWMNSMRLKMNDDKTEFILFGSRQQLKKCESDRLRVNDIEVTLSTSIRYLGAYLDAELKFKLHITKKCQAAMLNLRNIRSIRKFLDRESCNTVVVALVLSHLDYANSLLFGVAKTEIHHLQRIQNMSVKLVLNFGRYDSSTEALKRLHWLPIESRIKHKIITIVHKCLFGKAPMYLKGLLTVNKLVITD